MYSNGIKSKIPVYHALMIRFIIGRYGRNNIGFLWTIVEPTILCVGVMIIWSFTKGSAHGLNIVAFVFTGYMPLTLWRHQTGHSVNCLSHTKFLTLFRNLSLFDAMIARLILEFVSVSAAAIVVLSFLCAAGIVDTPYDMSKVVGGWLLMGLLATSAGILIASLSAWTELIEKLNQPFQYFLLPFCGAFFMIEWIPDSLKQYALMFPTVHSYEMIRSGFFGPSIPTHENFNYGVAVSVITAGAGFFVFRLIKDDVEG